MTFEEKLKAPFPESEIEWRVSRAGSKDGRVWALVLAYIDARAVADRLDEVVGIYGWQDDYEITGNGVICRLSIMVPSPVTDISEWRTKTDGASFTEFESFKGGISDSFKRAAAKFGIGRYLYNLTETFAIVSDSGKRRDKFKDKKTNSDVWFKWDAPSLPAWAVPKVEGREIVISRLQDAVLSVTTPDKGKEVWAEVDKAHSNGSINDTDLQQFREQLTSLAEQMKGDKDASVA